MEKSKEKHGPLTIEEAEREAGLITEEEAARRLDMSVKTLRRRVRQGLIPPPITDGPAKPGSHARKRHREKDIAAYIRRYVAGEIKAG